MGDGLRHEPIIFLIGGPRTAVRPLSGTGLCASRFLSAGPSADWLGPKGSRCHCAAKKGFRSSGCFEVDSCCGQLNEVDISANSQTTNESEFGASASQIDKQEQRHLASKGESKSGRDERSNAERYGEGSGQGTGKG